MSNAVKSSENSNVLTKVNPNNWNYIAIDDPCNAKRFRNVMLAYEANGNRVGRQFIKDIYKKDLIEGIIATIVWGYPKGRYPGGKGFNEVFKQLNEISKIILDAQALLDKMDAEKICLRFSSIRGIGVSTFSKMLYLSETTVREGICLIYDQMVMRAISRSQDRALISIGAKLGSCIRQKNGKDSGPAPSQCHATPVSFTRV